MSALKVLQHFPSQQRTLLSTIGVVDPSTSDIIMFNLEHFTSRLSHKLAFHVNTIVCGRTIHHTTIDKGASTFVMSLSHWRAISSPDLNQSPAILKAFDGHGFKPYRILNSLAMELGGETISINVEVVNSPINYNLFLGRSWFYMMTVVASSVFRTLQYPH